MGAPYWQAAGKDVSASLLTPRHPPVFAGALPIAQRRLFPQPRRRKKRAFVEILECKRPPSADSLPRIAMARLRLRLAAL
jgi:hypothetical protein